MIHIFQSTTTAQALKYYYDNMVKHNHNLDNEWRYGDAKQRLQQNWRTAIEDEKMFVPAKKNCAIQSLADLDPWQDLTWKQMDLSSENGSLVYVWCWGNQSGKDEFFKFCYHNRKGSLLCLKKPVPIKRLVQLCMTNNYKAIGLNVGMADSKNLSAHCDFLEEMGNYGAPSSSEMFQGKAMVYTHEAIFFLTWVLPTSRLIPFPPQSQ